jgi:universal stress protein E
MANRRWRSFLVTIRDCEHPPRALLTKATRIAQRYNGKIELLHVIAQPYALPSGSGDIEATTKSTVEQKTAGLERVANRLRKTGIKVSCKVVWDYPAADAIVRYVSATQPDVVLAESHHHNLLSRWFISHTEWELIRSCPRPLWLVKTPRLADDLKVLTAVDPFHANAKPAALDEEILRNATIAAQDGKLGLSHIYAPPIVMISGGMGEPLWVAAPAIELKRTQQRVKQAVDTLAERYGVKKADRIVLAGDVSSELAVEAKRWGANLLVMGAVSRSALKRIFIGNTAERVIENVNCDVLVVKPRSFKSSVGRKKNVPVLPPVMPM